MTDENLNTVISMGGLSVLAAASRAVLSEDRRTLLGFVRGAIMAVFVGTVTGLLVSHYNLDPSLQGAIIGIFAFIADDILLMILSLVVVVRDKPEKILDFVLRR